MLARKSNAPKDRIILRHTPSHWIADFVGSVAAQVRSIHGSSQVPTGFDGGVTVEVVRRAMAELNPNSEIVVANDEQSLDFTVASNMQGAAPQSAPHVGAGVVAQRNGQSLDFTLAAVSVSKPQVEHQRAGPSIARDAAAEIVAQDRPDAAAVSSALPPPATAPGLDLTPAPAIGPRPQAETQRAAPSNPAPMAPPTAAVGPVASAPPARATTDASDAKQRGTQEALKRALTLRKELGLLVACSYLKEHGWTFEAAHEVLNRICPAKREACRVLVVDDNLDTVHTTALLLRARGHEVEFAINGLAALFIAQRFRPQVVLLDLGLPDSDGVDLARQLKHHPELKDVRIIAMTGRAGDENRRRAMGAGCDEYLMKPVAAALLDAMMEGPKANR